MFSVNSQYKHDTHNEDNKTFERVATTYIDYLDDTGLIVGLRPANERRRYFVTTSLIDWPRAWNQPCDISWEIQKCQCMHVYI